MKHPATIGFMLLVFQRKLIFYKDHQYTQIVYNVRIITETILPNPWCFSIPMFLMLWSLAFNG